MKNQYWQMVRGVYILAVIMIHCPQGAFGVGKAIWLVIRQFINFPVALFIFMAGYFVAPKSVNMKWLVNRGGRLIIPFILWSTIYTIKNAVFDFLSSKELIISFFLYWKICNTTLLYFSAFTVNCMHFIHCEEKEQVDVFYYAHLFAFSVSL